MSSDVMFGVSGFRARVGESFEPSRIVRLAQAFGSLVLANGEREVVVGRDSRTSGEMAFHGVAAGLLSLGLDVADVGLAPTPTILHATARMGAGGSVTITASHNPVEWNGLEFSLSRGRLLDAKEREQLRRAYESPGFSLAPWNGQGRLRTIPDAVEWHLERIMGLPEVMSETARGRRFRVALDACNGAGSRISLELLRRLGCEVVPLYCEPDGRFPRSPEPSAESLHDLRELVVRERADLGFAHDSDADRLVLVDERGEVAPEEYTFALVADALLRRTRRPLVTTVVTGGLLDAIAAAHGVPVLRTPVGVGHVVDKMIEAQAAVGGESTGGVVIPGTHLTTDGIAAIAVLLSGLAERGGTLSEWMGHWPVYHLKKSRLPLAPGVSIPPLLEALSSLYPDATIDRIDGVKFVWKDAWVSVRPSGTEPLLRVFAESSDPSRAEDLVSETLERAKAVLKYIESEGRNVAG